MRLENFTPITALRIVNGRGEIAAGNGRAAGWLLANSLRKPPNRGKEREFDYSS